MPYATLGELSASEEPRTIEGGSMMLDRAQYAIFKRRSRMVYLADIDLGDVIEVSRPGGGAFAGGALVATVVTKGKDGGEITFNGFQPQGEKIRAIAGVR